MTVQTHPEAAAPTLPAAATDAPEPSTGASPAARTAHGGGGAGSRLQHDELAALAAVASGATAKVAARMLGVADRTMRRRLTAVVEALGATCPINAVFLAAAQGLLTPDLVDGVRRGEHRIDRKAPGRTGPAVARTQAYARHRNSGHGPRQAASLVGISSQTTRERYERQYRERTEVAP